MIIVVFIAACAGVVGVGAGVVGAGAGVVDGTGLMSHQPVIIQPFGYISWACFGHPVVLSRLPD